MRENEKQFKDDAAYFADREFISHSQLKDFFKCEYFYECKYITKTFVDEEERDYFIYGSEVDALLTEAEGNFEERFIAVDRKMELPSNIEVENQIFELNREIAVKEAEKKSHKALLNKKESLMEKMEQIARLAGKTQITNTVYKHIKQSAAELLRQPLYNMFGVGTNGMSQEIIAITIDGIKRRGKFDYLNIEKKIIADLKTCANIEKFNPRMYATQLAYYRRLASEKYEIDKSEWDHYLLVVDKQTEVKRSKIFCISKDIINEAENEIEAKLREYVERKDSGFFNPITETTDRHDEIREEVCWKCGHYNDCPFSLQRSIAFIY
jgi:hypothetical protein